MLKKYSIKFSFYFLSFILCCTFSYGQARFIENIGQLPKNVFAKSNVDGGVLFIEKSKLTFAFFDQKKINEIHSNKNSDNVINTHAYSMEFLNSSPSARVSLLQKNNYYENYYVGDKYLENAHFFSKVFQKGIYNNIDLILYSRNNQLKYDIIIQPQADYEKIKIKYKGHENIRLSNGNLIIQNSFNSITELAPYAYQVFNSDTVEVKCNYVLKNNHVSFAFPNGYVGSEKIIIDPTIIFSTYSGSNSNNFGFSATYDNLGCLYSAGISFGIGYPTTLGAYQVSFDGGAVDVSITKYDSSGTYRIYSTFLGGNQSEFPHSLVVNSNKELFILGTTGSDNFPTTSQSFSSFFSGGDPFFPSGLSATFPNGSDIFVSKLSSDGGQLLSSTYIGGSKNDGLNLSSSLKYNYADEFRGEIDIDLQGNIYIATSTSSPDFPVTNNVFQGSLSSAQDGCIIKMDNNLQTIIWSSFLGGDKDDGIYSLALDSKDNLYVSGGTCSNNFFSNINAFKPFLTDTINPDAFIVSISSDGKKVLNGTYFGSIFYDQSYFIEISNNDKIYITGQTKSISDSLVFNSIYFNNSGGQFIAVFDTSLSTLLMSTVFGSGKGTPDISPSAFLIDKCNNIYLSGWGSSLGGPLSTLNLDVTNNAFQSQTDGNDFYLCVFNEDLDSLIYGTFFGGGVSSEHVDGGTSRFDEHGVVYQAVCAGCNNNNDFPIYPNPGAVSSTNNSGLCNNGVFKFDFDQNIIIADFIAPTLSCDLNINFINSTQNIGSTSFLWDFGDGTNSTSVNPSHSFLNYGQHIITLIAYANDACNFADTISYNIFILSNSSSSLPNLNKCYNTNIQIGIPPSNDSTITYQWQPSSGLSATDIPNPISSITNNITYSLIISSSNCIDTLFQEIIIDQVNFSLFEDTSYCQDSIVLLEYIDSLVSYVLWSNSSLFEDTLSTSLIYSATSPGTYFFKTEKNGCISIDSINILSDDIGISFLSDAYYCLNDTITIDVTNLVLNSPIISYVWLSDSILSFNQDSSSVQVLASLQPSSWFCVEVINSNGCILKDSVEISAVNTSILYSIIAPDTNVFLGQTSCLMIETQDSILWFDGTINSQNCISPIESSWFSFQVYNNSCIVKDSIYIQVRSISCNEDSLIIPTAFTPNNDGFNDYYYLLNQGIDILDFNLQIFNRLGQLVFQADDINEKWNGFYDGKLLYPQVFDYFLEITCAGEINIFKKGNITLIK